MSLLTGHRQRPIGTDRRDGPRFAVADRFAARRDKAAVVTAGGHNVTDVSALSAGDHGGDVGVELSAGDAGDLLPAWLMAST